MRLSVLGALTAITVASCAPPPQPPFLAGAASGQRLVANCAASDFGARIFLLPKGGFNVAANGYSNGVYRGPSNFSSPNPNIPIEAEYMRRVTSAFASAPPAFQSRLCSLDAVFIDLADQAPTGWGFWESDKQLTNGLAQNRKFIGLSPRLWAAPFDTMTGYRNASLAALLGPAWANWADRPQYTSASPNNKPELVLLAVLAHETGHIMWHSGRLHQDNTVRRCLKPSWRKQLTRNKEFRKFGEISGDEHDDPDDNFWDAIRRRVELGQFPRASDNLFNAYVGRNENPNKKKWPSLLATSSPEEDFVEVYMLNVLTDPSRQQLSSLEFTIPMRSKTIDIVDDFAATSTGTKLWTKASCLRPYI
jgi:hypothetical protein